MWRFLKDHFRKRDKYFDLNRLVVATWNVDRASSSSLLFVILWFSSSHKFVVSSSSSLSSTYSSSTTTTTTSSCCCSFSTSRCCCCSFENSSLESRLRQVEGIFILRAFQSAKARALPCLSYLRSLHSRRRHHHTLTKRVVEMAQLYFYLYRKTWELWEKILFWIILKRILK